MANPGDKSDDVSVSTPPDHDTRLSIARHFLDEPSVKTASRDTKVEFLRGKDIPEDDIETLLSETDAEASRSVGETAEAGDSTMDTVATPETEEESTSAVETSEAEIHIKPSDRPPIITYPEFLAETSKPPPLLTPSTVLTTLSAFLGLSTLLYGVNKHYIEPSLALQSEARHDYHSTISSNLNSLTTRLSSMVSDPQPPRPAVTDSDTDDPTELFHRDAGTQTVAWDNRPLPRPSAVPEPDFGARTLDSITAKLHDLRDEIDEANTESHMLRILLDGFGNQLREMESNTLRSAHHDSGYSSSVKKGEPDDEIKKARESIRKLKGTLLGKMNFPIAR